MSLTQRLLVPFILLLLSGCASKNVSWDYDPSQSLTGLKSYAWMDSKELLEKQGYNINSLMDERVRSAVDGILKAKGLTLSGQQDSVDVLVNYTFSVKGRLEDQPVTTSIGFGRNSWGVGFSNDSIVREYDESSLMIDFIDPETKKVLWQGVTKSRVQDKLTPEERINKIYTAVTEILSGFPRPPAK